MGVAFDWLKKGQILATKKTLMRLILFEGNHISQQLFLFSIKIFSSLQTELITLMSSWLQEFGTFFEETKAKYIQKITFRSKRHRHIIFVP